MELEGTYTFNAPQDVVWEALQDPEVLARVMPGCEKLEEIGENEYEGIIKIRVGPVQGKFNGKVLLSDINRPESYKMTVDGKGAPGFMKGEGQVTLEANGDSTLMHYAGTAQVGGRIASVGQRLLDSTAKALTKQSLDGLNAQIEARMQPPAPAAEAGASAGTAAPAAPAPPKAPSQMQFATGVAKTMIEDALPEDKTPVYVGLGLLVWIGCSRARQA